MELKGLVLHDRYKIYEQNGAAGMATVCLARDVSTSAVVTVLVLEPPVTRDSGSVRRFLRSAEMAARLNHPYVAPVEDYGQEQGVCYMVTRYDQQATLRDVEQKSGLLPAVQCAWITACIASALEAAIARGIAFHGALRPDNIIVTVSGDAQVAGFGIAAASGAPDEVLGKGAMHYAAPEQVEGRTIDVRTDLYALGVMVYEMLTGHVPSASDAHSFLGPEDVAGTSDRMDQFLKDVPERLRPVLSGLLAWDPDARFASPGDLIETLVLGGFPAPQRPSTEPEGPDLRHGPVLDASFAPDVRTEAVSMVGMSELYVHGKNGVQRQREEPAAIVGGAARAEVPRREEGAAWETGPASQSVPSSGGVLATPETNPSKPRKRRLAVPIAVIVLVVAGVVYAAAAGWLSGGKPVPEDTTNSPTGQTVTTGKLDIKSTPSGASITVDGKSITARTPTMLSNVAPGSHTVLLHLSGYVDGQQTISATAGNTSAVRITLVKNPSPGGPTTEPSTPVTPSQVQTTLRITSTPAGAAITMDGKATGKWTPSTFNVAAGSHTVVLSLSGYKTLSKDVSMAKGQHGSISLALTRTAPVVSGLLRVTSTPAGAAVKVDGKAVVGKTPLTISVSVGSHTLQVSLQGYETWSRTKVDVVKGIETAIVAQLVAVPTDKDYVNKVSGFGFKYPGTWQIVQSQGSTEPLPYADVRSPLGASVRVTVIAAGGTTVESYAAALKVELEKAGGVVSAVGSRTVKGIVYEHVVCTLGNVRTEYCMLLSAGNIYRLACAATSDGTAAATPGFLVILGSFFAAP
ncbi:MAG: serine/threonine-protein kinase [Candidatus Cryosericum sp.]